MRKTHLVDPVNPNVLTCGQHGSVVHATWRLANVTCKLCLAESRRPRWRRKLDEALPASQVFDPPHYLVSPQVLQQRLRNSFLEDLYRR